MQWLRSCSRNGICPAQLIGIGVGSLWLIGTLIHQFF